MGEVARRAGVSRATLYRHCEGREALIEALASRGVFSERTTPRERVLKGARAAFARWGIERATIEQIAARAAVSEATVYRLFKNKEGVVAAFLEEFSPRRAARALRERPSGDLRADLLRFATQTLSAASESPELVRIAIIEGLTQGSLVARVRAHGPMRTLPAVIALMESHRAELRGMSPTDAAQAFMGITMSFGVFGPILHGLPVPDPESTAAKIVALFCDGALATPKRSHARPTRDR